MTRTLLAIGTAVDFMMAAFLLIVFGWILDSWHDPNGAWVGAIVTASWLVAFVLSAGAPIVAYLLNRRHATPAKVALAVWLPALLLSAICVLGLIFSPP